MDLGNGVCLDRIGKFCYLGVMVSGCGGASSTSVTRVYSLCGKCIVVSGFFPRKDASLKLKGTVYVTWTMNAEHKRYENAAIDVQCLSQG